MGVVEFNHNPAKFYCPKMEREKKQNGGTSNNIGICSSCWQGGPIFDLYQILLHSEMRDLAVILFLLVQFSYWTHVHWVK